LPLNQGGVLNKVNGGGNMLIGEMNDMKLDPPSIPSATGYKYQNIKELEKEYGQCSQNTSAFQNQIHPTNIPNPTEVTFILYSLLSYKFIHLFPLVYSNKFNNSANTASYILLIHTHI
jgi:hypothetical protein